MLIGFITDDLEELVAHLFRVVEEEEEEEEQQQQAGGGGGETYVREGVSKNCYTTTVYVAVLKMHIEAIGGNNVNKYPWSGTCWKAKSVDAVR